MDGIEAHIAQNGSRETWPGEREPGVSDAETAYQNINAAFVTSFKNAVLMRTRIDGGIPYLQASPSNPLLLAENKPLYWPHGTLSPQVEDEHGCSAIEVENFVKFCSEEYVSKAPFLRDIPTAGFYRQPEPAYFTLAMACIGSMLDGQSAAISSRLWWSSLRLLMGQLETDNREARKMELVKAWSLLETYGLLSSDRVTWNRTSMVHGYVETALWRLLDSSKDSQNNLGNNSDNCEERSYLSSIALYFALIDLLRSIHFGQASSFADPEVLSAFRPTRKVAGPSKEQHLLQAGPDDALIELIAILSRIHTVAMVFDPLFRIRDYSAENATKWRRCDQIPFSSMTELAEMASKLRKNLEVWQNIYLRKATPEVAILWHFCFIYLTLPSLQLLVELSGYLCRDSTVSFCNNTASINTASSMTIISRDLGRSKEAIEHAWKILRMTSDCNSTTGAPIWRPFALFSAALVVWANISFEQKVEDFASLKILHLFEAEIVKMRFPCSLEMSTVLKNLQSTALR